MKYFLTVLLIIGIFVGSFYQVNMMINETKTKRFMEMVNQHIKRTFNFIMHNEPLPFPLVNGYIELDSIYEKDCEIAYLAILDQGANPEWICSQHDVFFDRLYQVNDSIAVQDTLQVHYENLRDSLQPKKEIRFSKKIPQLKIKNLSLYHDTDDDSTMVVIGGFFETSQQADSMLVSLRKYVPRGYILKSKINKPPEVKN